MKMTIFLVSVFLVKASFAGIFQGNAKNDDQISVGINKVKSITLSCYSGGEEILNEDVVAVFSKTIGNKGFGEHRILAWKSFNGSRIKTVNSSRPHYIMNEKTPCKTLITYE